MSKKESWRVRLARRVAEIVSGRSLNEWAVTVRVDDDSPGWHNLHGRYPHDVVDHDAQYLDALEAWRKNPLAKRIITLTADYVIGDGITLTSTVPSLQKFVEVFWYHAENNMPQRLAPMCDELARAGDLFPVLFRNKHSGMSYVRFVTKDQVDYITTAVHDWEKELKIAQKPTGAGEDGRNWYTPHSGYSKRAQAVILHYSVNRPIGAAMGESDLAPILPWLLRYSRMLEDRIRLHWAARLFLWIVTVPSNRVKEKASQYAVPPAAGSVVVKDEAEDWQAVTPSLRGAEASHDMMATRQMIDAGSSFPPHWRGEAQNVNLSMGQAMQQPAERFLKRRQDYFVFVLRDMVLNAYARAHAHRPELWPELPELPPHQLLKSTVSDVSTIDNGEQAAAAKAFSDFMTAVLYQFPHSGGLRRRLLGLALKFAGDPLEENDLDAIMREVGEPAAAPTATNGDGGHKDGNDGA